MNPKICLISVITPGHNEFVTIWFQIIVVLFFWISFFLTLANAGIYSTFITKHGSYGILLLNFLLALSATMTLNYLIFYPISEQVYHYLKLIHYCQILTVTYFMIILITMFECKGRAQQTPFVLILVFGLVSSVCMLIFINIEISQYLSFGITAVIIVFILIYDFTSIASENMIKLFYETMFIETIFLLFGVLIFIFRLPEICCSRSRCINLYFNS